MIRFRSVSYRYPTQPWPALRDVCCDVPAGSFTLVAGRSGSGKSTLLRCPNGLIPHFYGGSFGGSVQTFGHDTRRQSTAQLSRMAGFVAQEPEGQTVADRVEDEVAFALENAGLGRAAIHERVDESLAALGIEHLRQRALVTLSGGERQRVAIAAACVFHPRLLSLDEPTSQIDPWSADEVISGLVALNRRHGVTILLAEHRLRRLRAHADHLLTLDGGRLASVSSIVSGGLRPSGGELDPEHGLRITTLPSPKASDGRPAIEIERLSHAYGDRIALDDISLTFKSGTVTALLGRNGSGKTTLLKQLNGLLRPATGRLRLFGDDIAGRDTPELARLVGYLPQQPGTLLFNDSIAAELRFTLRCRGVRLFEPEVTSTLELFGLSRLRDRHPFDLSGGERQRAALAAVVAGRPPVLALDEPTRGMDERLKLDLAEILIGLAAEGATVVLATHDVDLARRCAAHAILLDRGRVVRRGSVAEVLAGEPALVH